MKSTIILLLCLASVTALAQPYQPTVIWDRSGETDSSAYGYKILPLGDQNDDGFADWAVYAQGNGGGWHGTRASYLEFFHGGSLPSTEPYLVYRADTTIYEKTWYSEAVGDLNRDGYQDWEIGIWALTHPTSFTVPIFFGGPGPHTSPDFYLPMTFRATIYPVRDFNGDGYDDLLTYDFDTEVARIYYGGFPMDTLPDWVLHQPPAGIIQTIPSAVGDFNGDGYSDFICFNPNSPFNTAIFLGGATPDTVPAYFWANTGYPVAGIDSLNGDAYAEWGGSYVHFGRPVLNPNVDAILNSNCVSYGADARDINRDGFHDLILYTPSTPENMFGCLDIHLGGWWLNPDPVITIEGWTDPLNLIGIWTAAGLGDVNGDGIDDIAIGAYDDFAYLGWRGRCVILSGDTSLHAAVDNTRAEMPQSLKVSVFPNPFNNVTTIALNMPFSIGKAILTTYNLLGQVVARDELSCLPGPGKYIYDAHDLSSGLYFLRIEAGAYQTTQKLMLIR